MVHFTLVGITKNIHFVHSLVINFLKINFKLQNVDSNFDVRAWI